jgi:hypothetical protein
MFLGDVKVPHEKELIERQTSTTDRRTETLRVGLTRWYMIGATAESAIRWHRCTD